MTEPFEQLEAELSGMQPVPMPGDLAERVELDLANTGERSSPWADRFLMAAMGSGALAACVLVGVLLVGITGSDGAAAPSEVVTLAQTPTHASTPLAFAHGNPDWVEFLK